MPSSCTQNKAPSATLSLEAIQSRNGCWPVMLTPFDAHARIDFAALDALVEWYLAGGAQGLFACCLSSEMFYLEREERLALVRRVVDRVNGRVPVIASGAFVPGTTQASAVGEPAALAEAARQMADTGVSGVVFITNQFAAQGDDETLFLKNVEATLSRLDASLALGLYECPVPYKRLLVPASIARLAQTGRFRFLKDTCCDMGQIQAKLAALKGTSMHFYNANTATLLASLQAGGSGFSGVGANAIPHLYAWLSANFEHHAELAGQLQAFLDASAPVVDDFYPHSVKYYLHRYGVPMGVRLRLSNPSMPTDATSLERFHSFHEQVAEWEKRLGLASPFAALMS